MCEALERIYLEVHGERLEREKQEAIDKAVAEAVAKKDAEKNAALANQSAYIKELEARLGIVTT